MALGVRECCIRNRTSVLFRRVPKRECGLMKRKDKLAESKQVNNSLLKLASSRAKFVLLLMALTFLCFTAMAQENTSDYWLKKGQELDRNGSYNESIQAYYKALNLTNETLKKHPNDADAWQTNGLVWERLYKIDEAALAFGKATELNPTYIEAWHHKGKVLDAMAYRLQGQERIKTFEDAIKAYDKAIEINPKYGDAWKDKGYSLNALATFNKDLNKHNESLEAFDKAIKLIQANDTRNLALAWEGKALALTNTANALADMAGSKREEAIKSYEKAIELDPEFTGLEAQLYRAGVLADLGRYNESIAAFDKAIETKPANPPGNDPMYIAIILTEKGNVLEKMGEHAEALKAFDNATSADPNNGMAWKVKGVILSRELKRYDEAAAAFDNATRIDPGNVDIWLNKSYALDNLALTAYGLNDPDNFTRTLDGSLLAVNRAIELDSNNSEAWSEKGFILCHMGPLNHSRYNESISAYNRAIELDPKSFEAWKGKGQVLGLWAGSTHNNSLSEEAVKAFDEAISLNQKEIAPRLLKAAALSNLGILNQSPQVLDEALGVAKQNSERSQIWFEKAHFYAEQGDYNQTLRALKEATDLSPQDEDLWINGGFLLSAVLDRYNESISYFDVAIRLNPENAVIWQYKGDALKALGRNSEADAAYAKAKKIGALTVTVAQENTAKDWYKKGQDLNRNGSWEEAVKAYDEAIELEPNNVTFYIAKVPSLNMLTFITNNQSKRNESLEAIDKALQIDPKNPSAWELKGSVLYSQTKRYNESLEAYDKAIENIGSYKQDSQLNQTEFLSYIWTSKSISLWQLTRYNESLEAVDKAVQIDPSGNFDAWAFKGQLLTYLGRYNESLQAFDKAAAIGTANYRPELEALPWIDEGYVLMDMGRYEEANLLYQKIIGLNFTSEGSNRQLADAWRGRGNALASLGKYNESLQAFDRAIELNSERAPYALTSKGDALLASGRYDEAIIAYDRALKLYPEFADAGIALTQKGKGDSLIKLGKREEALVAYGAAVGASDKAITAFNNATPLDKAISFTFDPYPLGQTFWNNRGSILKALGRQAEADAAFAKAKELGYQG
jgi:tetratricopeptide (TPR) repeat protein